MSAAEAGIDARAHALVRVGALIAIDAAPPSYMSAAEAALEAGATYEELVGTLIVVMPVVGVARVVSAAPNLGLALGYDVGDALETHLETRRRPSDSLRVGDARRDRDRPSRRSLDSTVAASRASSASTAARRSGSTDSRSSSSTARSRRITCTEPAPYSRISVTRQRQKVLPAPDGHEHLGAPRPTRGERKRERRRADQPQRVAEVVEHLHGGRGIVDRGRERPVGDVDHDPDRERGILLDRALVAERDHPSQLPVCVCARVLAVDLDERSALGNEVADAVAENEPTPVCLRVADEAATVEGLNRARARAPDDAHRLLTHSIAGRQHVRRLTRGGGGQVLLEGTPARSSRRTRQPRRAAGGGGTGRGRPGTGSGSRARGRRRP